MKVRRTILEHDYPILKTWWERRGTEAPQAALLPPIGVVAHDTSGLAACAWLYEVKDAPIAMVEWEATCPDAGPMRAVRGLNMVFDFFEKYCEDNGIAVVLSWVAAQRGDGRILANRNWKKCPGERHELMAYETKEALCPQS